jgi:hypothetical protein
LFLDESITSMTTITNTSEDKTIGHPERSRGISPPKL